MPLCKKMGSWPVGYSDDEEDDSPQVPLESFEDPLLSYPYYMDGEDAAICLEPPHFYRTKANFY